MKIVQVKHSHEDTGNCRSYYRTIKNNQLICLQDEGGAGKIWYTCVDDGCWEEPNAAINFELNEIEIVEEKDK